MKYTNVKVKWNEVTCYYNDENNVKKSTTYKVINYFYIKKSDLDYFSKEMGDYINANYIKFEDNNYKTIYHDNVIKVKMYFMNRDILNKAKALNIELFESDLEIYVKFMVNNDIQYDEKRNIAFIDIETDLCNTPTNPHKAITSLCLYVSSADKYYIYSWGREVNIKKILEQSKLKNIEIILFKDEIECLQNFFMLMKESNIDIIAGWFSNNFDIPYLYYRSRLLRINIQNFLGFTPEVRYWQKGDDINYNIDFGYINCIDLIPILARATSYQYQPASWSLASVAKFYLTEGYEKREVDLHVYNNNEENFIKFLLYNLRDVEILKMLNDKMGILNYAITLQCEVCPVHLEDITFNSRILELFLKKENPNVILPDKKQIYKYEDKQINLDEYKIRITGAHTMPSKAGIYHNVCVFDFKAMYSSIYKTFNISPDTLDDNGELKINDMECSVGKYESKSYNSNNRHKFGEIEGYFNEVYKIKLNAAFNTKEEGLIPKIIKKVIEKRQYYQELNKKFKFQNYDVNMKNYEFEGFVEFQKNKCLIDSYKLIANAMYGVTSYSKFRLYNPQISGAITFIGRKMLLYIKDYLESINYLVVYGDTDSIFVYKNNEDIDGEVILKLMSEKLKDFVNSFGIKSPDFSLQIEFEKYLDRVIFKGAKKKYYGFTKDNKVIIRGFSPVKRDTPEKVKLYLLELYDMFLYEKNKDDIVKRLKEMKKEFKNLTFLEIGSTKHISRNILSYNHNPQHVEAAKYSNKYLGTNFQHNSRAMIIYLKSSGNLPQPKNMVISIDRETQIPSDFIIDYDRHFQHYILDDIKLLEPVKEIDVKYILQQMNPQRQINDYLDTKT